MSKAAQIAFVAFLASLLTLLAAYWLAPDVQPGPDGEAGDISPAELAGHASADDCWMAIEGEVYDVTAYIPQHGARCAAGVVRQGGDRGLAGQGDRTPAQQQGRSAAARPSRGVAGR